MKKFNKIPPWRDIVVTPDTSKFTALRKDFDTQVNVADYLGLSDQETISRIETTNCELDPRTYSLFLLACGHHPKFNLFGCDDLKKLPVNFEGKEAFKAVRKKAGMTQRSVANHLNLSSDSLVSWYERGRQQPSIQTYTLFLLVTNSHPDFWVRLRVDYFLSVAVFKQIDEHYKRPLILQPFYSEHRI